MVAYEHETRAVAGLSSIYGLRMLGMYMVLPVLSLHASQLSGATPLLVGLSVGAYGLAQAILQVPFGLWSDRYGRRRVIAGGLLIFALGSMLAAVADSAWLLVVGRTLQGAGAIASAVVALLADVSRPEVRTRAMAAMGASVGISFALGLVAGPSLSARFSVPLLFWLTAVLSAFGALFVVTGIPRPPRPTTREEVEWHGGDVGPLLHSGPMLRLNISIFIQHLMITALFVIGPVLMARHLPAADHGTVYGFVAPLGLGLMVLSAVLADRKGRLRETIVLGSVILVLASVALFFAAERFWLVVAAIGLTIVGAALASPAMPAMLTRLSPRTARGTAAGLFHMCQFTGSFVGGLVGGLLLQRPDLLASALVLGTLLATILSCGLPRLQKDHDGQALPGLGR